MQATARMASVVSSTPPARRRLIRDVRPTHETPTDHLGAPFVGGVEVVSHGLDSRV